MCGMHIRARECVACGCGGARTRHARARVRMCRTCRTCNTIKHLLPHVMPHVMPHVPHVPHMRQQATAGEFSNFGGQWLHSFRGLRTRAGCGQEGPVARRRLSAATSAAATRRCLNKGGRGSLARQRRRQARPAHARALMPVPGCPLLAAQKAVLPSRSCRSVRVCLLPRQCDPRRGWPARARHYAAVRAAHG